jgi:predicted esterase
MLPIAHSIKVIKTARYYTLGEPGRHVEHLWFVLHGYGQLAAYFIRHFQSIVSPTTCIVAPEGLSRYYLDSKFDRIGASWMTKEDRLTEIVDQQQYLNQLLEQFSGWCAPAQPVFHVLGFSQGTATAWRWAMQQPHLPIARLILWGGTLPTDFQAIPNRPLSMQVVGVYGEEDEYFSEQKLVEIRQHYERFKNEGALVDFLTYKGGHTIDQAILGQLYSSYEDKR